jgi:dipeptidase
MRKSLKIIPVLFLVLFGLTATRVLACTSILVSKGASKNSSVMITYACDGEFHPRAKITPAADYQPGDSLEIRYWGGKTTGKIAQPAHTYKVVGLMNEHQLVIGETTFSGREELQNPQGLLPYWTLMNLALQRARTAREAVEIIGQLVEEYGYRSTGETFSIGDPNEAWIMEMIGPGPGGKGAQWVALRIPDGYISCHANKSRITTFPLNDPENCLYSKNVISFAVEKGYYSPKSGKPFRFNDAYCPDTPRNRRYADTRVWSIFRRAAPSQNFSAAYHRGAPQAEAYPLWIKPDKKLDVKDVFSLMRDHYEGTAYDMTRGIDAGPYGSPNRWRPISWKVDSVEYVWERPISTQQTGFSFVSQSRAGLPDAVGGVLWYGLDDTYTSCYMPLYCSINELPRELTTGKLSEFSWDSAWWIFNLVANYANLKYSYMIKDIQKVQQTLEGEMLAIQPAVETAAVQLVKQNSALAEQFLTDYSVSHVHIVVQRWQELARYIIAKYNDGYVQEQPGRPAEKGYPESWLRRVLKERPQQFKLRENIDKIQESKLVD